MNPVIEKMPPPIIKSGNLPAGKLFGAVKKKWSKKGPQNGAFLDFSKFEKSQAKKFTIMVKL